MAPLTRKESSSSSSGESSDSDEEQITQKLPPSQILTKKAQPLQEIDDSSSEEIEDEEEGEEEDEEEGEEDEDEEGEEENQKGEEAEKNLSGGAEEDDSSSSESDDDEPQFKVEPVKPNSSRGAPASDSESESESEPDQEPAPLAVSPVSSKPMEVDNEKKTQQTFFKRLFSLDDEIKILKGILEFEDKIAKRKFSNSDMSAFHDFVGKSLSIEVTDMKLLDKVRRMKGKYEAKCSKGDEKFPTEHHKTVYELSKKVWGDSGSKKRTRSMSKKVTKAARKRAKLGLQKCSNISNKNNEKKKKYRSLNEEVEKIGNLLGEEAVASISKDKAHKLEEEIKKLRVVEAKHQVEKMALLKESFDILTKGMEKALA